MMKKYILLYILLPAIGLPTAGMTWFFWTMPSPEKVCQKTTQITSGKQASETTLLACVKNMAEKKDLSGLIAYRKEARCIVNANTTAEITACSTKAKK